MKSRRDPAHRAEADARAAAEAANRGETDDHETDVDETIIVKSSSATAPTDRAERGQSRHRLAADSDLADESAA